jgi:hypothetical protein
MVERYERRAQVEVEDVDLNPNVGSSTVKGTK